MKVVIHREARAELRAIARWYGDIETRLQSRFEQNVLACMDRVITFPRQFPVIAEDFRRALVHDFPYEIFFELLESKIKVLAVAHSSRQPFYWIKRK